MLLEGATDPPHRKITSNGHDFSGSTSQCDRQRGVFVCAIGGSPLLTTLDLSPTTASLGWLLFSQPVSDGHVVLVKPLTNALDQRIEVLCAMTKCHLGHYFGKENGYCINASSLNFVASEATFHHDLQFKVQVPVSWRSLEARECESSSVRLLRHVCLAATPTETLVFGAGCFWHVEFSLSCLPGVILTETGYAGGTTMSPTYESVCCTDTGRAEVVRVTFDPHILSPKILMDCFLAFHDSTMVHAVGKHLQGTGQYRSCIFVTSHEMEGIARDALNDCRRQLNKDLSTHVCRMDMDVDSWFWKAEEQHQRYDEKRGDKNNLSTLSTTEWLGIYGQRKETIWGSSHTSSTLSHLNRLMKCIDAPYIETRDLPTTVSYELKHRVILRYHYDTFIFVLYQSLVLALYHTAYLLAFGTCQTGTGMIPALNLSPALIWTRNTYVFLPHTNEQLSENHANKSPFDVVCVHA